MTHRRRSILCVVLLLAVLCLPVSAGLLEYVARPEPDYTWSKIGEQSAGGCRLIDLAMTSQVWQGIPWKHTIRIFVPRSIQYTDAVLLVITGGNPGDEETQLGTALANLTQGPVAILFNIPNQPLFDNWADDPAMAAIIKNLPEGAFATVGKGITEDTLIAFTFVKYFETGDENWPLLLPMTKSAVKAMDTIQAFAKQTYNRSVNTFVVTGASKRGWTTWLTAAAEAEQARVKGIAPMVIDTLNIPAQMAHQIETWGKYSEQIDDYTKLGLQQKMASKEGGALMKIVDPYSYRERIKMPKLIINGANDRYWVTDALNLYWNDLVGPKWVLYDPNSGHGLEDRARVLNTMSAFVRAVASGKSLPEMSWRHGDAGDNVTLSISANPKPIAARLWVVHSPTLDFRDQTWKEMPMKAEGEAFAGSVAKPRDDNMALFGEADFDMGGHAFTLSTQVRMVPKS
jgi:PhoPQ-activated pathogenicity-related protein